MIKYELAQIDQFFFEFSVLSDGTLFSADHEMALKMEGLERPRRKRGRPPKRQVELTEEKEIKEPESPETLQDQEELEEDADGRRRRKRKVPQRFVSIV